MQIWFCQSCGARVTKADLGNVTGLSTTTLVYCKDCLKKENRADRTRQAAKLVQPDNVRPSSKGLRRKSTGKNTVQPPPEPEPVEAEAEDERPHRRARNAPRAGSSKIRIATIAGVLLLITGVVLVNINLTPAPTHISAPPHPVMGDRPDPVVPVKPVLDEKAATAAFEVLDKEVAQCCAEENNKKIALIDAYLAKWNDSIVASRARTLREKLEKPEPPAVANVPDKKPTDSPPKSSALEAPETPRAAASYSPVASPLILSANRIQGLVNAGDYAHAIVELDDLIKQEPVNAPLLVARAEAARLVEDYDACLLYATRAADVDPKIWTPLSLTAIAGYALGRDTIYNVDFAKMMRMCDQDDAYKRKLKWWVNDAAFRGRAIVQGQRLEKREPKLAHEFFQRGYYRTLKGQLSEGEADLRKAIQMDTVNESEEAYKNLILIYGARRDPKGKMELCKEWIKTNPKSALALNDSAWEFLMSDDESLRDPKAALPMAQRAAELDPKNYAILDTLALAWFHNNDVNKALALEKQAIALIPPDLSDDERAQYDQHLSEYELVKPPER